MSGLCYESLIIGLVAGATLTLFSVYCIGRAKENELIADSEWEAWEEHLEENRRI